MLPMPLLLTPLPLAVFLPVDSRKYLDGSGEAQSEARYPTGMMK
jgi:hypothetical protein